jgi:peptidoglycan/LPS O-acetylase OafA/YrhL
MAGCNAVQADPRRQARADLTPDYSLYLDFVRCVAAFAVFLEHVASYPFSRPTPTSTHPLLAFFGSYGNSAVIVFFVLSGYVIAYVVSTRERTAWAYSVNRISRLYSVVLPALALTCAFDALGQWVNPDFYAIRTVLWKPASWQGYTSSLFFVNEFQAFDLNGAVPGTNAPFWSLSFEATYYIVAGLVLFAPLRYALPLALVVLGLAGRTIAALLPLWVLGFWLYKYGARLAERVPLARTLLVLSSVAIMAFPQFPSFATLANFGAYFPWGHGPYNRNLLLDYATALAFAVQLVAARRVFSHMHAPRPRPRLERLIRWLGATTFPMYAMHYPALCLFAVLSPFTPPSWAHVLFISAAVIIVIALMTPVCEWLKDALRRALTRTRSPRIARVPTRSRMCLGVNPHARRLRKSL